MHFMNEYEIKENVVRFANHPALGPATQFLHAFMNEVNMHSDGWPYWSPPVHACNQLITLINRGVERYYHRTAPDVTIAEVQKALVPIKSFMTRRGNAAGMKMPVLQLTLPGLGAQR